MEDEEATEDELPDVPRGELGGYEVPRSVDFHAELPRDLNAKLYERKLHRTVLGGKGCALV